MSQIHLCIAQHVEFSTLCWKLNLKFAASAWTFSLHLLPKEHPHIGYSRSRGEIKGEWLYLCELLKNLGVSVSGIVPCSVSVGEIRLRGTCRYAVGRWSPVPGLGRGLKVGLSCAVGSLKICGTWLWTARARALPLLLKISLDNYPLVSQQWCVCTFPWEAYRNPLLFLSCNFPDPSDFNCCRR